MINAAVSGKGATPRSPLIGNCARALSGIMWVIFVKELMGFCF